MKVLLTSIPELWRGGRDQEPRPLGLREEHWGLYSESEGGGLGSGPLDLRNEGYRSVVLAA